MKVIIAVAGRFHAFHMARELNKKKLLKNLITSEISRPNDRIPKKKILRNNNVLILQYLEILGYLVPFFSRFISKVYSKKNIIFDNYVKNILKNTKADIFIGFTNQCLNSLALSKKKNITTIADCGSAYIEFQHKINLEEYRIQKIEPKGIYKIFEKQTKEYKKILSRNLKELELTDYILVGSTFAKSTFPKELQKKVFIVPYGVDLKMFYPIKKSDDIFRIIYCGRLEYQKGVHYLIKAFNELNLPNSELYLIGFAEVDFQNFIEKNRSDRIKVMNHIPQHQLYKHYSKGSIFIQPSIQEGFSMVILEAMACGLPVITTTNTAAHDIIRENIDGFVIPIRDTEKLKEKINYFYNNPEQIKKMSINAKKRVLEFTWDKYGEKLEKALKKSIKNK